MDYGCSGAWVWVCKKGRESSNVEIGKGLTYSMITLSGETRIEDIIK